LMVRGVSDGIPSSRIARSCRSRSGTSVVSNSDSVSAPTSPGSSRTTTETGSGVDVSWIEEWNVSQSTLPQQQQLATTRTTNAITNTAKARFTVHLQHRYSRQKQNAACHPESQSAHPTQPMACHEQGFACKRNCRSSDDRPLRCADSSTPVIPGRTLHQRQEVSSQ
jgi:hypothetical protein